MHGRLSKFIAQDRYKDIVAFHGLANEPKMTALDPEDVISWTQDDYEKVRRNGFGAVVFGTDFMGLKKWKGQLSYLCCLALDVDQYVIFNPELELIAYPHRRKIEYAFAGWSTQADESMDTSSDFGPTLFAE